VFTARYALSPYIKQIHFVSKGLTFEVPKAVTSKVSLMAYGALYFVITCVRRKPSFQSSAYDDTFIVPLRRLYLCIKLHSGIRLPEGVKNSPLLQNVKTDLPPKPRTQWDGIAGSFKLCKGSWARVWPLATTLCRGKEWMELWLCSHYMHAYRGQGKV
jgi:hypothetical protein